MKKLSSVFVLSFVLFGLVACSGSGVQAFSGFFQGYLHGLVPGDMPQSTILHSGDDDVDVMRFDLYARSLYDVMIDEIFIGVKYSGGDVTDVLDSLKLINLEGGMVIDEENGRSFPHELYGFVADGFVLHKGETLKLLLQVDMQNDLSEGESLLFYLKDVDSLWTGTNNMNIYGEDVEYKAVGVKVVMSEEHKVVN